MARKSKPTNYESQGHLRNAFGESEEETSISSKKEFGINITIEWIENLDPCKINEITVKMEFMKNILVVSDSISVEKGKVDIDIVGMIQIDEVNLQFLDIMLSNPVLITVTNSGATSSNQLLTVPTSKKEDKDLKRKVSRVSETPASDIKSQINPNLLGMCNLDITGLIKGKKTVRECLLLDSDRKLPPMGVVPWVKLPKLWVNATATDWEIFDKAAKMVFNTLGVTIESVYNAPEYLQLGSLFDARILVPSLGNRSNLIVFPNGMVTSPKEADSKKRWLTIPEFDGSGARSNYCICPVTYDVINTMPEELDLDAFVQKMIPVIQWNMWRNSLLMKSDISYFYSKLIKYRVWPIEIYSTYKLKEPIQKSAKSDKKRKPTPPATALNRDHFLAFINLSALLYPGVTKARVACQLYTFSHADLISKFGQEHPSLSTGTLGNNKSKGNLERSRTSVKEIEENKGIPGVPVYAENGLPVFIIVEVELLKPLTPKQNPEFLLNTLKNYVSVEGKMKKKSITKSRTRDEKFISAVKKMVFVLSEEYEEFCHEPQSQHSSGFDTAFQEFLCRRENFYKMKTTLEHETIEIINDKFGPMSRCDEIPDMYIYLVETMHRITNQCLSKQDDTSAIFNIDDYQLYAEEAMEEGDYDLAKHYIYQKLSCKITNPDYWIDCAIYFNIADQTERAIEAVREALYLDFNHQLGLLMYALIMARIKDLNAAEITFQVLLTKYPDFLQGWVAFWLYCYTTGNTTAMFVALQTAKKLNYELTKDPQQGKRPTLCEEKVPAKDEEVGQDEVQHENEDDAYLISHQPENKNFRGDNKYGIGSFKNGQSSSEPLAWSPRFASPSCMYIKMAVFMMRLGFYEYSSMCLTQYIYPRTTSKKKVPYYYYYQAVNNYLLGRYTEALPHLQNFVKDYGKDCFVWGLMGHCYYKLQNHAQAIACYEYVIEAFNRPADIHLIYLRMGYYYLGAKKYSCAKKILHTACKYSPTPKLWKGLGIACLRMEEPDEAEIAFSEANYLDNHDPETWAFLAITNSLLGRLELYKNCYEEAKKRNLQNHELNMEMESCKLLNCLESEASIFLHNHTTPTFK